MPRPSNKLQRRGEIVEALLKVMAITGYESASIQAIGREAGLAPGLVHYHFRNKQEILVELIGMLSEQARVRYLGFSEKATSSDQHIEAFIDSALALGEGSNTEAVAAWVLIGAESIRQKDVRKVYQSTLADNLSELEGLLKEYAKENDKKISGYTIKNIAAFTIGAIEGAYQLSSTAKEIMPRNYAAQ